MIESIRNENAEAFVLAAGPTDTAFLCQKLSQMASPPVLYSPSWAQVPRFISETGANADRLIFVYGVREGNFFIHHEVAPSFKGTLS